jgi:hypothetical protein
LAKLLQAERGVRHRSAVPPLTHEQILAWADAHHARTGDWPTVTSGPITDAPGETWRAVQMALVNASRGLPKGTLARLLAEHRGRRNGRALPPFTIRQILAWADAHRARTGDWPATKSGPITDAPGETWAAVDAALVSGGRGMPGGNSLARVLAQHRGKPNPSSRPALSVEQIKHWIREHHRRTGSWPGRRGGPIPDATGETWLGVACALSHGYRGLPGGSSLAQLVSECRSAPDTGTRARPD